MRYGQKAIVHGIESKPEYNGQIVTIGNFVQDKSTSFEHWRYEVKFDDDSIGIKSLKSANLKPLCVQRERG